MVGEITMICMDNSKWMNEDNITWFINQSEAIELYCERKLQAHPDNVVGIVRMGELDLGPLVKPTNDMQDVKRVLDRYLPTSNIQLLNLLLALKLCKNSWSHHKHLDKRIVVFAGGPLSFADEHLKAVVELFKEEDTSVVVDVVDFFPVVTQSKAQKLNNLVTYMNEQNIDKNKEGIYFRVQADEADGRHSISDHLSTSSILPPLVAEPGVAEGGRKKKKKKRPVAEIRTKKQKLRPFEFVAEINTPFFNYKCV